MDLTLEQRCLRFLSREEEGEARSSRDLWALSADDRVLEGECIQGAVFAARAGAEGFAFDVAENLSKFRPGDTLLVGDGEDLDAAQPVIYRGYDAVRRRLLLERDRWSRGDEAPFEPGRAYCIDRRPLDLRGRLQDVVRAAFATQEIAAVLHGEPLPAQDEARLARARAALAGRGLDRSQIEAGAGAIAAERLCLVQGPPGTGKTRLCAEVVVALCRAGCRIALTAFTHRAVDQVLITLRALDPELTLVKLATRPREDDTLERAGVQFHDPRQPQKLPAKGCVVAGTCFALAKLPPRVAFHYTVLDEAAQLPIPHALAGMLLSRRWLLFGDHCQLGPVVTADHQDREITDSVFAHLHRRYGGHLLDVSYRMNAQVCALVSDTFYAGRLTPSPAAAARRMEFAPGGALDEVLDPEHAVVLARIDHLQPGQRSSEEANLVADLAFELRARHGVPAEQIAIVAPFRAQVRLIASALERKQVADAAAIVLDTVERMQGQEREVVILSLASGDPDSLRARAAFFFSTNRLNVALSRARSKVIVVASRGAFEALPREPQSLAAAAVFRRLLGRLWQVDLTAVYGQVGAGA